MSDTMKEADLQDVLRRNGFVPCDIPACNCGSWHARYGLPERMQEIKDILAEAGYPLSNENGNLVSNALRSALAAAPAPVPAEPTCEWDRCRTHGCDGQCAPVPASPVNAAAPEAIEKQSAWERYDAVIRDDDDLNALERLRLFCSFAMNEADWLDVEPFFEALTHPLTASEPVNAAPAADAEVIDCDICSDHAGRIEAFSFLPVGTKLYTHPPAASEREGEAITEEGLTAAIRMWFPDRAYQADYFAAAVFGHPKRESDAQRLGREKG